MMKSRMRWLVLLAASLVLVVSCNDVTGPVAVQKAESIPGPRMALVATTTPQVAAGEAQSCGLKSDGSVVCWGYSGYGITTIPSGLSPVTAIATGNFHNCALQSSGNVVCWGFNGNGQTAVPSGLSAVTAIGAGYRHSCALKSDGSVVCWGANGNGTTDVPAGLSPVTAIAVGDYHNCAIKPDGDIVCWGGENAYGERTIPSGLSGVMAISAGSQHTCALKSDGSVVCWGRFLESQTTVPSGLSEVTAIEAGGYHSCAVKSEGSVVCWGSNAQQQTAIPSGLFGITAVAAGRSHTCALKSDGTVVCWGSNNFAQSTVPADLNLGTEVAAQSVAFTSTPPSPAIVGGTYGVFATGGDSGNPVTFSSLSTSICTIAAGTVSFISTGDCIIAADQEGNETFAAAAQSVQTFAVTAPPNTAPVLADIAAQEVLEGSELGFTASASDGENNQLTFTLGGTVPSGALITEAGVFSWTPDDGNTTRTFTVIVSDGTLTDEQEVTITVRNAAPTATFLYSGAINEAQAVRLEMNGATDPSAPDVSAGFTYAFNCGSGFGAAGANRMLTCPVSTDNGSVTVRARIIDKDGGFAEYTGSVTVSNVAPDLGSIAGQVDPVAVNTIVSLGAAFSDAGSSDTHTATIDWNDATALSNGIVVENNGAGSVNGSHSYTSAGVYRVKITLTDDDRGEDFSIYEYIVVYDPSAGFVTGGGWINSPAGALTADPSATGTASFGFVSKYQKGAAAPTGSTEFQFHAGNLAFKSTQYDWLVVSGKRAQYKGEGTVNGIGGYNFLLTVTDGVPDKFRIRITSAGGVVYDNNPGASTQLDGADPQAIGGGSIVVHSSVK